MPMSPMTQLLGGEITHSQPLPVQNGEIVVKLELTAPSTPGMVTLHADGQADKMPQIADSSAAAIDFVVTVGGGGGANTGSGTGGNAAGGAGAGAGGGSMPAPMHGCAFGGSETASSIGPAWLLALLATALLRRARS